MDENAVQQNVVPQDVAPQDIMAASLPDDLRDKLDVKIRENWDKLVAALMQLAEGVYREEVKIENGEAKVRIYSEKPDKEVAQYLLNQVIGKPKETQVMEGRVVFQRDF